MPTIEVLVGMIASGKSTYARKRADEGALVVCHDDLTAMLHARYRYEPEKRDVYREMEADLVEGAFATGHDVVIDRTHLTRESRKRWIDCARWLEPFANPLPIIAVVFPIAPASAMTPPYRHAVRRFHADDRGRSFDDWLRVAEHHFGQWTAEPIGDDEGFRRIIHIPEEPH